MKPRMLISLLFVFCILTPMLFIPVSFAQEPYFVSLSNRSMLSVLQKKYGKGWTFYQPSSKETKVNCSSDAFLKNIDAFPVIGMNGNQTSLILLRKNKKTWEYAAENPDAIMRDGFSLLSFSVDENIDPDENCLFVYFEFMNEQQEKVTLDLRVRNGFSYFSSISVSASGPEKIIQSVSFQPYYGYTFISEYCNNYALSLSTAYTVLAENMSFALEEFTLSACPLVIDDLLVPAVSYSGIDLYSAPSLKGAVVFQIAPGEKFSMIKLDYANDWKIIQYKGTLFFGLCSQLELIDYMK